MVPLGQPRVPAEAAEGAPTALRLALVHGRDFVFRYRYDPPGFEVVGPGAEEVVGHPAEALRADPSLAEALLHPEDRPLLEAAYRSPRTVPLPAVQRVQRPDGREGWVEVRRFPVFDPEGRLVALEGIVLDVTARTLAERALRDSLHLFQSTVDALPLRVAVLDEAGRVVAVNAPWRAAAARGEEPGPGADYVRHASTGDAADRGLAEVVRGALEGATADARFEARRVRGGREEVVLLRVLRVPGEAGRARILLTSEDVTEQRRAEGHLAELQRLREEHAQREVERLRELDKLKTELLNIASHELNTPLTALKLQLELLGLTATPEQAARFAGAARSVDRLSRLVRDMLDVARLQGGQVAIAPRPCDLAAIVREAAEAFAALTAKEGLTLQVDAPGPLGIVADPDRIAQVVANLLGNATKFTPAGGRVVVRARAMDDQAVVEVQDTGLGFSAAQGARLFQAFSQVHGTAAERRGGAGLGLYIARGLVEAHGGAAWATSPGPGQGATFAFRLPLVRRPAGGA